MVAVLLALGAQAEAAKLTVTASRTEALYTQGDTADCSELAVLGNESLPLHIVRLSVESPSSDVSYRWSAPTPSVGFFVADLPLGPSDQTRLVRTFTTELGNECVLAGEALALYNRPTILWVAPPCTSLPTDTTRPFRGDRVRFHVKAAQNGRPVGRGTVSVGYGRLATAKMLVADPPFERFRDGHGKPDGEKIFIDPEFGASFDFKGQTALPPVTRVTFDNGDGGSATDVPPCEAHPGLDACARSPFYDTGGKHLASMQVDLQDGSALCDNLTVNVRVAPLSLELDVSAQPRRASYVPGDPIIGNPHLRVRARNTSPPDTGFIVLTGNLLTCETEAKVDGTILTRTTSIDLQHCSSTVSQPCGDDSDCQPGTNCPTCQPDERCLTADHCSIHVGLGCTTDRDCERPRCPACEFGETCVKVLPLETINIASGDAVDLIDSNINLFNVLTVPAKIKETWTVQSFNAGAASDTLKYQIKPRPDVPPPGAQ
jgi:hypothetical protein